MLVSVEQLIGDLLFQHNCVIVPSFGGFVAQRLSAKIDAEKGLVTPPRKSVMFNKQLINNDGLLVAAFAQANHMSYEEASVEIKNQIGEWEARLQMGGRITFDRVGNLFYDQERNLCFEQDRFYNLLLESFGLSAVRFVSVADVEAKASKEAVSHTVKAIELEQEQTGSSESIFVLNEEQPIVALDSEKTQENTNEAPIVSIKQNKSNAWRYVAAACLLPVAFYSFWLPVKTDVLESGVLSLSDFNPFRKAIPGSYVPMESKYQFKERVVRKQLDHIPKQVEVFSYELDEDTYIPVSLKKREAPVVDQLEQKVEPVQPELKTQPEVKTTVVTSETTVSGPQAIVGSFLNRPTAQELINQLAAKGVSAQILEKDGKVRVSVGSPAQMKQVEPILKEMGITPWILK